jgi:hypothetical protein
MGPLAKAGAHLTLEGMVDSYGDFGLSGIGPKIGDTAVAEAITDQLGFGAREVKVILMVEAEQHLAADGRLSAYRGFGGTDVTPPEPAEVDVGSIRLLDLLRELDGRTVCLYVEVVA